MQLHALAFKLAPFLRYIELPEAMADWSLASVQLKLIKIEARVLRHASAITFQLTDVAVSFTMVRTLLAAIRRLPAPTLCSDCDPGSNLTRSKKCSGTSRNGVGSPYGSTDAQKSSCPPAHLPQSYCSGYEP